MKLSLKLLFIILLFALINHCTILPKKILKTNELNEIVKLLKINDYIFLIGNKFENNTINNYDDNDHNNHKRQLNSHGYVSIIKEQEWQYYDLNKNNNQPIVKNYSTKEDRNIQNLYPPNKSNNKIYFLDAYLNKIDMGKQQLIIIGKQIKEKPNLNSSDISILTSIWIGVYEIIDNNYLPSSNDKDIIKLKSIENITLTNNNTNINDFSISKLLLNNQEKNNISYNDNENTPKNLPVFLIGNLNIQESSSPENKNKSQIFIYQLKEINQIRNHLNISDYIVTKKNTLIEIFANNNNDFYIFKDIQNASLECIDAFYTVNHDHNEDTYNNNITIIGHENKNETKYPFLISLVLEEKKSVQNSSLQESLLTRNFYYIKSKEAEDKNNSPENSIKTTIAFLPLDPNLADFSSEFSQSFFSLVAKYNNNNNNNNNNNILPLLPAFSIFSSPKFSTNKESNAISFLQNDSENSYPLIASKALNTDRSNFISNAEKLLRSSNIHLRVNNLIFNRPILDNDSINNRKNTNDISKNTYDNYLLFPGIIELKQTETDSYSNKYTQNYFQKIIISRLKISSTEIKENQHSTTTSHFLKKQKTIFFLEDYDLLNSSIYYSNPIIIPYNYNYLLAANFYDENKNSNQVILIEIPAPSLYFTEEQEIPSSPYEEEVDILKL